MESTGDAFVDLLFLTARATTQAVGECSPMLLATREGREKVTLVLRSKGEEDEIVMAYMQAISICLMAGADTLYELRDVFYSASKDELPVLRPSEDPQARSALLVLQTSVAEAQAPKNAYMLPYGVGDDGQPIYEAVEKQEGATFDGPMFRAVAAAIDRWKDGGELQSDPMVLNEIRRRVGLLGRVQS